MALLSRRGGLVPLAAAIVVVTLTIGAEASIKQLKVGYYDVLCPEVDGTVRATLARAQAREARSLASVMRFVFHDCFVVKRAATQEAQHNTVLKHSDIMATPCIIVSALICLFAILNLSVTNLVALADPHSVGKAHSVSIVYRLYNTSTSGCPATTWMWPTVMRSTHSALGTAMRRPPMA
ncbi:hypothetical protein PR202_ga15553 [Eleusine coracana subsp. coracana]|uniref:Plant heme peroxidase family profile domain-containing protein n=1 Tax=Eleusine coracana subsp. coracana TaxID=191504 RepID=A0AAV5CKF4_ELECO|nr:hypothetical protein PR202_ga15553 [Eleusine coracana subsp. coracana]